MGSFDEWNRRFEAVERFFEPDISLALQNRHCAVVAVTGDMVREWVNEEVTATIEDYRAVMFTGVLRARSTPFRNTMVATPYKRDLYSCMYTTVVDSFIQRQIRTSQIGQ
jgi:hypothetical protein